MEKELSEWAEQLRLGMEDSDRAPNVACPACGRDMVKEVGMGKLSGYICMSHACMMIGRRIGVAQLADAEEWRLLQDEAKIRTQEYEAMRKRNGAHDKESSSPFDQIAQAFRKKHSLAANELTKRLVADQRSPIAIEWSKLLSDSMDCYCTDCHGYHKPTAEHPLCLFCSPGFVHASMPAEIYFNYRGWKFTPPFICMGCGIEVCYRQWAFSRSCGACDVSNSRTRRVLYRQCFVGPHEKLPTWSAKENDIPEGHFIDPKDADKYPVMKPRKKLRPLGAGAER